MSDVKPPPVMYRLGPDNRIISLNEAWTVFAEQNSGFQLDVAHVIGQSIMSYISGDETKHLYETVFNKVRQIGKPIVIPFRCDAPEERRFMKLCISPSPDDFQSLNCVCTRIKSEQRPPNRLLHLATPRSDDLLIMCSWCKRVKADGTWVEIEAAIERMGLFYTKTLPRISHGCCETCLEHLYKSIG